eukprot:gene5524-5510_t
MPIAVLLSECSMGRKCTQHLVAELSISAILALALALAAGGCAHGQGNWLQGAIQQMQRGDHEGALETLAHMAARDPALASSPMASAVKGQVLSGLARHSEAASAFQAALGPPLSRGVPPLPGPMRVDVLYSLAYSMEQSPTFARRAAVKAYRDVLVEHPRHHMAHTNLANLLADQRRYEQAEAHLVQALSIEPGSKLAQFNLHLLRQQTALEEARTSLQPRPQGPCFTDSPTDPPRPSADPSEPLAASPCVERVHVDQLTPRRCYQDFVQAGRPVVLTGAAKFMLQGGVLWTFQNI